MRDLIQLLADIQINPRDLQVICQQFEIDDSKFQSDYNTTKRLLEERINALNTGFLKNLASETGEWIEICFVAFAKLLRSAQIFQLKLALKDLDLRKEVEKDSEILLGEQNILLAKMNEIVAKGETMPDHLRITYESLLFRAESLKQREEIIALRGHLPRLVKVSIDEVLRALLILVNKDPLEQDRVIEVLKKTFDILVGFTPASGVIALKDAAETSIMAAAAIPPGLKAADRALKLEEVRKFRLRVFADLTNRCADAWYDQAKDLDVVKVYEIFNRSMTPDESRDPQRDG